MILVLFFSYWPATIHPTPAEMSYNVLMIGAISIFAITYYAAWARKIYKGPVVEISVH